MPKQETGKEVSFGLQGLSLDINKGGLEIGGGFLHVEDTDPSGKVINNFYGEAIIKAEVFSFMALGGYSPDTSPASFFIYANINIPLGGPPFFFVTGLAAGFGINRNLKLPTIDSVGTYPLIPANAPPQQSTAGDTVKSVVAVFDQQKMFEPKAGEYWIAAGVQFTTFEMIDSFALLTVSFGVDFQLALLGVTAMSLPPEAGKTSLAYIEIDILAEFTPALGLFSVDGRLSKSSFIFVSSCHISGGFAFYVWFGGPHAGNFLVTIGGFHPAFVAPPFFPTVPRLELSLILGPLSMGGKTYFALTSSAIMAGMEIWAVWTLGPLKAWFDAGFDFLLGWAPFYYNADAYIHIGISLDLGLFTLSLHVGVDLEIQGPEFGGMAHIDLDIISFTIHFGAEPSPPPPVGWESFRGQFLPANGGTPKKSADLLALAPHAETDANTSNLMKVVVSKGLSKDKPADYDWIVDPDDFALAASSTIPANEASWNPKETDPQKIVHNIPNTRADYNKEGNTPYWNFDFGLDKRDFVWNTDIQIGPMNKKLKSNFIIRFRKNDKGQMDNYDNLSVQAVVQSIPKSLWGPFRDSTNKEVPKPDQLLIPNSLTGFLIKPIPTHPQILANLLLEELLFEHQVVCPWDFAKGVPDDEYKVKWTLSGHQDDTLTINISGKATEPPIVNNGYVLSALLDPLAVANRDSILMAIYNYTPLPLIDVNELATHKALSNWPQVKILGN